MQAHFGLVGTQVMMSKITCTAPFQPGLLMCLIYLVLEGVCKSTKVGLAVGVTIGGDAAKSGKKTNLLADICTYQKTNYLINI